MPALTIQNIPDDLYRELQQAAVQQRKSISSHIIDCLRKTVSFGGQSDDRLKNIQNFRSTIRSGCITEDDIEQAVNEGRS